MAKRSDKRSSRSLPWIHAAIGKPVLAYLDHVGVPFERYLDKHRLPLHEWNESRDVVLRHAFGRFVTDVARSQGLAKITWDAVAFARKTPEKFLFANSPEPTLYCALRNGIARAGQHSSVQIDLVEARDHVSLCRQPHVPGHDHDRDGGWYAFGVFVGIVREYAGESWSPPAMAVPSDALAAGWVADEFPDCRFLPSDGAWWFAVPRNDLSRPPIRTLGDIGERTQGKAPGLSVAHDAGYAEILSRVVRTYLRSGAPRLEFTADLLEISPRTLKRWLQEVGWTYSELLGKSRFGLAKELLETTDQKIAEIAREAGYQTPSNFARAFRRVAGVTPRQYRGLQSHEL